MHAEVRNGDVVVSSSAGGYSVSRVLTRPGSGQLFWQPASLEATRSDALLRARQLASALQCRLLLCERGDVQEIAVGGPIPERKCNAGV